MNEFNSIEKELSSLIPKSVPKHLTERIEKGLGDAGNLAMRRLPEEIKSSTKSRKTAILWLPWVGMGIAASLVFVFLGLHFLNLGGNHQTPPVSTYTELASTGFVEDPESPIHGVSVAELERQSGMPVGGWTPTFKEKLLDRVDEGVVSRPSGVPARQVRMQYMDEILWQHPATDTRILSTQPRQEIILIDLDLY